MPYGPSWYAATMVAAPERPALNHDLDVDVCVIGAGLAGPDGCARARAARLVGRGAGSAARCGRRVGAQWRVRVAGICRADRRDRRPRRPAARQGTVGAVRGGRRIRAPRSPAEMPGVQPRDGPPLGAPHRRRGGADRACRDAARRFRRRCGGLADRPGARGAAQPALFPGAAFPEGVPHPSAQLRARPCGRRREARRAHLPGHARALASIRPACASASRRRTAMVRARHVVLAGSTGIGDGRCADRRDRAADLDLCGGDGAARGAAVRGGALHRRGRRHAPRGRLLPHRRRRPADVGRAHQRAHLRRRGGSRPRCATTS